MNGSLLTLPLRLSLRTAQLALLTTRAAADAALELVELAADALSGAAQPARDHEEPARDAEPEPRPAVTAEPPVDVTPPIAERPPSPPESRQSPAPPEPSPAPEPPHVDEGIELVEEVAEPGAEDGAGAQVRVAEPFEGYAQLRAADVVDRLRSADPAELGAIELYELSHRRRRMVLDAIARESRRPR